MAFRIGRKGHAELPLGQMLERGRDGAARRAHALEQRRQIVRS